MATATKTQTRLTETFGTTSTDNVDYRAIFKAGNEKYRVSIRRNTYDFQSHARVDILLLAAGWVELINLHHNDFAGDLHAPIANRSITPADRKLQMQRLAAELVTDAHRTYTA